MTKSRRKFSREFQAKVALEATREMKTVNQLSVEFSVHPNQISQWKRLLREQAPQLFETGKHQIDPDLLDRETAPLYEQIGRLKMELDWLKKSFELPAADKIALVEPRHSTLSIACQCALLGLHRSTYYSWRPASETLENRELMYKIDRIHAPNIE